MNKHLIYILLLLITVMLAGRYLLLPGYFAMHDDIQVLRQQQMHQCFLDGQIPCRWSPYFGAGYGLPMFNFYSPFPNYLGMIPVMLGFGYITSIKLVFLFSLLVSALGMYVLAHHFSHNKIVSFAAAISYTWAPYHLLDIFVRGALAESWGMAWIPWLIYLLIKLTTTRKPFINIVYSLVLAAMLLSHNVLSLWVSSILAIISLVIIIKERSFTLFARILIWNLLGVGLAAFFLVPVFMERGLITSQTLTQDYYDYRLHYVGIKQLFIFKQWGYGPSVPGPDDQMSFHLGYPQLFGLIIALLFIIVKLIKKQSKQTILPSCLIIFTFIILYLIHAKSYKIWELVPIITWTQFPWRLLSLSAFSMSLLIPTVLPKIKFSSLLACAIIISNFALHWTFAVPQSYRPNVSDTDKLTGIEFNRQQQGAIRDYQPITVPLRDIPLSDYNPKIVTSTPTGQRTENFIYRSNYFSLDAYTTGNSDKVVIPVFAFPMWKVAINGAKVETQVDPNLGLIEVNLPDGKSIITGWLKQTIPQQIGNLVSLLSICLTLIYLSLSPKKQ